MNDTSPAIEARYRDMISSKSPEERLQITCSMFDFAKTIAASAIRNDRPNITEGQLRAEVFRRFYAVDFEAEQLETIARHLERGELKNRPDSG